MAFGLAYTCDRCYRVFPDASLVLVGVKRAKAGWLFNEYLSDTIGEFCPECIEDVKTFAKARVAR